MAESSFFLVPAIVLCQVDKVLKKEIGEEKALVTADAHLIAASGAFSVPADQSLRKIDKILTFL